MEQHPNLTLVDVPQQQNEHTNWYQLDTEQTAERLAVNLAQGLDAAEIQPRQAQYGLNELEEGQIKSPWAILWEQLTDPLVMLLILAAVISAFLGKGDNVIAISAIVVLNSLLGLFQEYRAEKAMAALKQMAAPIVQARRGGKTVEIEASQLVPGDVVLLEAGNIVPADARIVESANLRVQEASLTGESVAIDKSIAAIAGEDLSLGDRRNMVYMGTQVAYGRGEAVVVNTGMRTELGRIAQMIQNVESEGTPLQRRMAELGKIMLGVAVVIMVVAFLIGLWRGDAISQIMLTSVAIAVAVVPEGLPAVVTISLALGTQRMLRRRALIRKLPAVETLGSVTVICSDKTGTLTENRMTVTTVDVAGRTIRYSDEPANTQSDPTQALLLTSASLCNDAYIQPGVGGEAETVIGDPTESAMVVAAAKAGLDKPYLLTQYPRIGEIPFSSERKRMTTVHKHNYDMNGSAPTVDADYVVFSKGAVDQMLDICDRVWVDGQIELLNDEWRSRIDASNNRLAGEGLRVLGVAYRPLHEKPDDPNTPDLEAEMVFIGSVGLIDPPRPEVRDAVSVCRQAGIRPVMITGDHPMTAQAIAIDLAIIQEGDRVITGMELVHMSPEALESEVEHVSVYARVSPEDKLKIVRALQNRGHIVAMTGDGVNDAPALKQADIGVAMGITGTDVSKEASDTVIMDDNFATIVSAAEEGRTIYDNVRRFIKYLLASNAGELFVLLTTQLIAGMTLPLTTLQILWMNLITDGIPALALGIEQSEPNAMKRAPYPPNESVLGRGLGRHIVLIGGTLGLISLGLGYWAWSNDITAANGNPAWNTMVFLTLTLAQMGHALGLRSHRESLFSMNFWSNKLLLGAVMTTIMLQLLAVYLPFFNNLFQTNPLTTQQLLLCLGLSTLVFFMVEFEKLLMRRGILK